MGLCGQGACGRTGIGGGVGSGAGLEAILTIPGDPQSGCIPQGPPASPLLSSSMVTLQAVGDGASGEGDRAEGLWTG